MVAELYLAPFVLSGDPDDRVLSHLHRLHLVCPHEPGLGRGVVVQARDGLAALHGGQDALGAARTHAGKARHPRSAGTL